MIKAALFDMDGTITDTEKLNVRFWVEAGKVFGFDVADDDIIFIRSLEAKLCAEYLGRTYPGFDYYEVREERRRLMREHVDRYGIEAKPGVREILDYLRQEGIKIGLATATKYENAERYLKYLGIFDLFDEVICTSMVKRGKPLPDVYLYACERIGAKPEECLAVEDSPNGVRSAHDAGCITVMIPDLTPVDEEMRGLIDAEASSLMELRDMLKNGTL